MEVAYTRMYHQPCRFVDHHELVVLIHHIQRDVLWFNGGIIVRTVEHQRDDVTRAHLIVALDWGPVNLDEARIGSFLDTVTRRVLHMFRHVFVDTYRLLSTIHLHAHVLIELSVGIRCSIYIVYQVNIFQLVNHHPLDSVYSAAGGSDTSTNSSTSSSFDISGDEPEST